LCYACRAELEKSKEKFDVIVGDLADPVEGGPCFQLYTKSFYELIVKPKLNDLGIFVTQVFQKSQQFRVSHVSLMGKSLIICTIP
jgi:spermidine synthase